MIRTAASRLVASSARASSLSIPFPSARSLSSTPRALIKVRSGKGTINPNPNPNPNSTSNTSTPSSSTSNTSKSTPPPSSCPSPAEAPPSVPEDITSPPPPFEPIVSNASTGAVSTPSSGSSPSAEPVEPVIPVEDKDDLSSLPSLDIDPDVRPVDALDAIEQPKEGKEAGEGKEGADGKSGRTGAGKKEYVSSIERQRRAMARLGLGMVLVGGVGAAWYLGNKDDEGQGGSMWTRFKSNFTEVSDVFNKPVFKQLLPDPLPPPHQRPYTLLVDLEGLLVHSSWDRQSGWRTAKRPGVDYFLAYLSQFYEIVLFTDQPAYTAISVAEKLDPFVAYLPYKLFRESTSWHNNHVVKDLTYLNRDLSKVVMLDTKAEHASLQPENAIIVKPWDGKPGDKGLVQLIPFLESIGIFSPPDVRPILKAYEGKDIPIEYAKKEAEAKRIAVEEWERTHPTSATGAGSGFLSGLFGSVANLVIQPGQTRPNQPMTYLEAKRAQAQRIYEEEQKYWRDNAEEFKRLIEEDKQRQVAEMRGSILGFISGKPAEPEQKPEQKQ